jgi:hypothetical protein
MVDERSQLGFLVAALGAAVLAVSVFLPWYGISITASGAASAQQELNAVAQQYGNTTFQTGASQLGAEFGTLSGHQLGTVSAHEALKDVSRILLLLAGVSLLVSLLHLSGLRKTSGGQIALVGGLAALFVLYRMVSPPGSTTGLISLSLGWGVWLALLSAGAIVGGGLLSASTEGQRHPAGSYGSQI